MFITRDGLFALLCGVLSRALLDAHGQGKYKHEAEQWLDDIVPDWRERLPFGYWWQLLPRDIGEPEDHERRRVEGFLPCPASSFADDYQVD